MRLFIYLYVTHLLVQMLHFIPPYTLLSVQDADHDYYTSSFYTNEAALLSYRDLNHEEEMGLITLSVLSLSDMHLSATVNKITL